MKTGRDQFAHEYLNVGERVYNTGAYEIRTRFVRLRNAARLGDRVNDWRVCWLGGWDKGRIFFVVMVERKCRSSRRDRSSNAARPEFRAATPRERTRLPMPKHDGTDSH